MIAHAIQKFIEILIKLKAVSQKNEKALQRVKEGEKKQKERKTSKQSEKQLQHTSNSMNTPPVKLHPS